jgi:Flp pilus assembly protein TadG
VSGFRQSLPLRCKVRRAQALVEFALIVPVMLLMTLGMIDLGRAFVFGIAVQEGTRQAARLAATANYDTSLDDSAVLGRLIGASNPALIGCAAQTGAQPTDGCPNWTFTLNVVNGGTTYTINSARTANALPGSTVTVTASGTVALLPGFNAGVLGLSLPQIGVQGQTAMVIL